jgi:hypothetical protein
VSFHSFAIQNVAERIVKMIFNDKNSKIYDNYGGRGGRVIALPLGETVK